MAEWESAGVDAASSTVSAETIGLTFAPRASSSISSNMIGSEAVLVDADSGMVHVLNSTAALVWQCFDGESSLADIAVDLADAFSTPIDAMQRDIVRMARSAAKSGLLDGIAPPNEAPLLLQVQGAVSVGESVFAADGHSVCRPRRRTLLINWSYSCSYCVSILPILGVLYPALMKSGVDIVLVDGVDHERTVRLLEERHLSIQVVPTVMSKTRPVGLFSDLGTPCAYLLDTEGRVHSSLAYGADKVVELVRSITDGDSGFGEVPQSPSYLSVGSGVCGGSSTGGPSREWQPTRVYRIGAYDVGIRAGSSSAEGVVKNALARHRAPDGAPAPANFSIVLSDPELVGRRELSFLLRDTQVVARSRSPQRVLMALAAHLSALLEPDAELKRVDSIAAVVNGRAILLPAGLRRSIDYVQPKLARMGLSLVDDPQPYVDLARAEVVVRESAVSLDQHALVTLDDPPPGLSEPPPVPVGRYPLKAWFLPIRDEGQSQLSLAGAVAAALGTMVAEPAELPPAVDDFARLLRGIEVRAVPVYDTEAVLKALDEWSAGDS